MTFIRVDAGAFANVRRFQSIMRSWKIHLMLAMGRLEWLAGTMLVAGPH